LAEALPPDSPGREMDEGRIRDFLFPEPLRRILRTWVRAVVPADERTVELVQVPSFTITPPRKASLIPARPGGSKLFERERISSCPG